LLVVRRVLVAQDAQQVVAKDLELRLQMIGTERDVDVVEHAHRQVQHDQVLGRQVLDQILAELVGDVLEQLWKLLEQLCLRDENVVQQRESKGLDALGIGGIGWSRERAKELHDFVQTRNAMRLTRFCMGTS
jgi:hypothetical protein